MYQLPAAVQQNNFWTWNVGQVISLIALLFSFWAAHTANVRRIERQESRFQHLETRMEIIYEWFCHNVVGQAGREKSRPGSSARVVPSEIEEGGL